MNSVAGRASSPIPETLLPHQLLSNLEKIAGVTAVQNSFELCGVELHTHKRPMTIQVLIRHQGGDDVSLDDCASLSEYMDEAIEASKLLEEPYVLEISSPGIGEYLSSDKDFLTFRSFPVEVSFLKEGNEQSDSGLLLERSEQHVHLNIKGRIKRIPRESVTCVRLTSPTG